VCCIRIAWILKNNSSNLLEEAKNYQKEEGVGGCPLKALRKEVLKYQVYNDNYTNKNL